MTHSNRIYAFLLSLKITVVYSIIDRVNSHSVYSRIYVGLVYQLHLAGNNSVSLPLVNIKYNKTPEGMQMLPGFFKGGFVYVTKCWQLAV